MSHVPLALRDVYTRLTTLELQNRIIIMRAMLGTNDAAAIVELCQRLETKFTSTFLDDKRLDGWSAIIARPFLHIDSRFRHHTASIFRIANIVSRVTTHALIEFWCATFDMTEFPERCS